MGKGRDDEVCSEDLKLKYTIISLLYCIFSNFVTNTYTHSCTLHSTSWHQSCADALWYIVSSQWKCCQNESFPVIFSLKCLWINTFACKHMCWCEHVFIHVYVSKTRSGLDESDASVCGNDDDLRHSHDGGWRLPPPSAPHQLSCGMR